MNKEDYIKEYFAFVDMEMQHTKDFIKKYIDNDSRNITYNCQLMVDSEIIEDIELSPKELEIVDYIIQVIKSK